MQKLHLVALVVAIRCVSLPKPLRAEAVDTGTSHVVSMAASHWHTVGDKVDVQFITKEGFPDGIIVLKSGDLALNDLSLRDGTIEFDMKPLAEDIPGIRFRQRDAQNAEEFYIRSIPDCRAENDCIQYSPVINGFMLWNVYPEYQTRAPVFADGWNHVRLVVSGKRMNVFINDAVQPTLAVGELLGNTQQGGLELHGPLRSRTSWSRRARRTGYLRSHFPTASETRLESYMRGHWDHLHLCTMDRSPPTQSAHKPLKHGRPSTPNGLEL